MRRLIAGFAAVLMLLTLAACSETDDYEPGSGTASFVGTEESDGLTNEGEINDASDWGPVTGIQ